MATSLSTLRSNLQTELRDPNDKIWSAAAKNQYINKAYFQIQKDNNFEWSENTTESSLATPYTKPTDLVTLQLVTVGTTILRKADKIALRRRGNDLTETGVATWYYDNGTTLGTFPVTTSTLTIDYKKKLTALSSDSDTIDFPDDFAEAIVKYAKYLAWSSPRGNRQTAQEALEDYGQELTLLMGSYGLFDDNDLTFGIQNNINLSTPRDNVLY